MAGTESGERVTAAPKPFSPAQLAGLSDNLLRQLAQSLLVSSGGQIVEARRIGGFDEWRISSQPLWRGRTIRVRLFHNEVSRGDLDRLRDQAIADGDVEAIAIAARGQAVDVTSGAVQVIDQQDFIIRLQRSPLIRWNAGNPEAAVDRVQLYSDLESMPPLHDRLGIHWTPSLAYNELPPGFPDTQQQPEDLFEVAVFKLFTQVFRFGGERFGNRHRGKPLPDALLTEPCSSTQHLTALVDCKAASSGYSMTSDHVLRFKRYRQGLEDHPAVKRSSEVHMLVVSSEFQGRPGANHPFWNRRSELAEHGLVLVYQPPQDLQHFVNQLRMSLDHFFAPLLKEVLINYGCAG